jgi:hypothetical protein
MQALVFEVGQRGAVEEPDVDVMPEDAEIGKLCVADAYGGISIVQA